MLQTDGIGLFSFSFVSSSALEKVKIFFKKQNKKKQENTQVPRFQTLTASRVWVA